MNIIELHQMGGPLFMSILSIIFLSIIALTAKSIYSLMQNNNGDSGATISVQPIIQLGIFAAIFGIFGQCIGLFSAFKAIEEVGGVSPEMLAGGLKVSMVSTLYGLFILLIAFMCWFGLKLKVK